MILFVVDADLGGGSLGVNVAPLCEVIVAVCIFDHETI